MSRCGLLAVLRSSIRLRGAKESHAFTRKMEGAGKEEDKGRKNREAILVGHTLFCLAAHVANKHGGAHLRFWLPKFNCISNFLLQYFQQSRVTACGSNGIQMTVNLIFPWLHWVFKGIH